MRSRSFRRGLVRDSISANSLLRSLATRAKTSIVGNREGMRVKNVCLTSITIKELAATLCVHILSDTEYIHHLAAAHHIESALPAEKMVWSSDPSVSSSVIGK
ncbi:hypothetical protein AGR7B_Cc10405 [Agrobacterium deltaense RV3]|nr:hypothetical protein AGR7B_Cc10405 [Agrobacterium deltaense RV3]